MTPFQTRWLTHRPLLSRRCLGMSLLATGLMTGNYAIAENLDVEWQDQQLTVFADSASATELVQELAEQTGVRFVATGDTTTDVTTEIIAEPLERAIAKLAPNHLLVHSKQDPTTVVEVVLMFDESANGSGSTGAEFLPSGSPAEAVMPLPENAKELLQEVDLAETAEAEENFQAGVINRLKAVAQDAVQLGDVVIEGGEGEVGLSNSVELNDGSLQQ